MIKFLVGGLGLVLIFQVVMHYSGLGALLDTSRKESKTIVASINAGNAVSMSIDKSFWSDTTTLTTTKGVFIINGLVSSIIIGEPLAIQTQQNGSKFLCNESNEVCLSIN